jgi:signal peptidase I
VDLHRLSTAQVEAVPAHDRRALRTTVRKRRRRSRTVVVCGALAALLLVAVLAAVGFRLTGGSWFIVQTPSMGTAAPVGSLVVDIAAAPGDLQRGDLISFRPPASPDEVYTHRIRAIGPDGIRTRGDINGAEDPWTLRGRDLIGRVAVVLPGVGWLVRSLPVLIGGLALVWLLSGAVRTPHRRFALRLIGVPLVVSAVLLWLKPFVNTAVLLTDSQHGRTMARIVSTGLLPVEVSEQGGARIRLSSGQVGDLWLARSDQQGHFWMSSALALPVWGWVAVGLLCAVPAALAVINGRRRGRHR